MIELDKIYNIDMLKGIADIPDESIDLVVTDCPYHIVGGGCSTGVYINKKGVKRQSGMLHRGMSDDAVNVRSGAMFDYNDIKFSQWLPEVYRVLKDGTHCYIMINARNLRELQTEAEKVGFKFQQLLVWIKNNATPNRYYLNQCEFILMLRKGPARNVNDMGYSNILSVPNIAGSKLHPTEKPVSLMKVMIAQSSNQGDIILDPFAGAGSTLIAARDSGRRYIGFEIDKKYYDIAVKRLRSNEKQLDLF